MSDMKAILDMFLQALLKLFPLSPFRGIINSIEKLPYLGYINWFLPISEMLGVAALWLTAITVYYIYSVVARWVKLIS